MYSSYPFERLPKLARTQIRAMSQLHSLFSDTDLVLAQRAAEVLLGLSLSCSVGVPSSCTGSDVAARTRAVWIELTLADLSGVAAEHSVWLELPFGLCEFLIDRTLGGEGALGMLSAGTPIDELGLGALAYLVARACAAAGSRLRLQMLQVGPPLRSGATLVKLAIRIVSRGEAAVVQLYAPSMLLSDLRDLRVRRRVLSGITLTLWADAGTARLDLATLRTLHAGDVLVLQRTGLWRESANIEFQGAVDVRVLGSATSLRCRLLGRRLEVETIACSPETGMTSGRRISDEGSESPSDREAVSETLEGARTLDLARDAPIEVALEIARFQLRLDELERVRPGDVLVAGRRIGEAVTLRAANQPIAEGELVDVEGELGVRITRILSE
jgi:type III secretion system YscQ/HrcQ family protein